MPSGSFQHSIGYTPVKGPLTMKFNKYCDEGKAH